MPSVKDVYSSNRLKAEHVRGKDYVLTIQDAPGENCARRGDREDKKIVLYFVETEKTLPLNVINSNTLADLLGDNSDGWAGKQITLFQSMTEMDGKRVECIRIRTAAELGGAPAGIANVDFGAPLSNTTAPVQGAAGTAPAPVDDPFRPILAGEPHNPAPEDECPI